MGIHFYVVIWDHASKYLSNFVRDMQQISVCNKRSHIERLVSLRKIRRSMYEPKTRTVSIVQCLIGVVTSGKNLK